MAQKRRKRKLNFKFIFLILVIILVLSIFTYYKNSLKPVSNISEEVIFTVDKGSSTKTIVKKLEEENLIKDSNTAYLFIKSNELTNIKAGEYILDRSWDVETIFQYINVATNAISDDVKVTIIEGDWAKDIAKKLSVATNIPIDDYLNLWNDEAYVRSLMDKYPFITEEIFNPNTRVLLEGYLFPNTYLFFKETDVNAVTTKILDETLNVYNEYKDKIENHNLSTHELFTLSSIVQYEASKVEDMKLIAGVFYNRMDINMKLQSSVTVCYAIDKEKEDSWMNCEVNPNFDSPYNTYKYEGLPPGPILNPGKSAIEATLNPTPNDYLYFMADVYGDGTVYYAKTYKEHSANVSKYLK
ncbi:MAG: endolytic transglycosylase MltG [Erysipelotrichaceae bacterium]|jgi:UPF0755 protein